MSARVIVRTLRFCTVSVTVLKEALSILKIPFSEKTDQIVVDGALIFTASNKIYTEVAENNLNTIKIFNTVNNKVAELEIQIKYQKEKMNDIEQENARNNKELHRVRQIQKEQDNLAYEQKKLELERESFVEAKKQSIMEKARSMGYSVQESVENGAVKLKLIKRVY